jgi:hypothetical protein
MKIKKDLDLDNVRKILLELIDDLNYNLYDRIEIYRFLYKLSNSENFGVIVNKQFSAIRLKLEKTEIDEKLNSRNPIFMKCGFMLKPVQETNWELYLNNELFLDSLDKKIARKIAFDINVAFFTKLQGNQDDKFHHFNFKMKV